MIVNSVSNISMRNIRLFLTQEAIYERFSIGKTSPPKKHYPFEIP